MHISNSVSMLTLIKIRTFLSPQRRPGISQSERRSKTDKREMSLESSGNKVSSDGMHTPEVAAPPKGRGCLPPEGNPYHCCDNVGPRCCDYLLVQNCNQDWEDGDNGIATGGLWCQIVSLGEVCLKTQRVGFTCNFMQDKPECLKNGRVCVLFWLLACHFLPARPTWRTICCTPNVFRRIKY